MRILILGHDGRATALCRHLFQSTGITRLWCWPGNAYIKQENKVLYTGNYNESQLETFHIHIEEEKEEEKFILKEIARENIAQLKAIKESNEEHQFRLGNTVRDEYGRIVLCDDDEPMYYPWFIPPKEPDPDPEPFEPQRKVRNPLPVISDAMFDEIRNLNPIIIPTAIEYYQMGTIKKLREAGLTVLGADAISFHLESNIDRFRDLCIEQNIPTYPYVRAKNETDIHAIYKEYHGQSFRTLSNNQHCLVSAEECPTPNIAIDTMEKIFACPDNNKDYVLLENAAEGKFLHASFFFDGKTCIPVNITSSYETESNTPDKPAFYPTAYMSPAQDLSYTVTSKINQNILPAICKMFEQKRMYVRGLFAITLLVEKNIPYIHSIHICPPDGMLQHVLHDFVMTLTHNGHRPGRLLRYFSNCCYSQLHEITPTSNQRIQTISVAAHANCFPLRPLPRALPKLSDLNIRDKMYTYNLPPTQTMSPSTNTFIETSFAYIEPNKDVLYSDESMPIWLTQTGDNISDVYNNILDAIDLLPNMDNTTYNIYLEDLNKTIIRRYNNN